MLSALELCLEPVPIKDCASVSRIIITNILSLITLVILSLHDILWRRVGLLMAAQIFVPRPDKFSNQCDISVWFQQFELFLQLSAVADGNKKQVLLSFLEIQVFQATVTAKTVATCSYEDVKTFLLQRYCTTDAYIDRIGLFEKKFLIPPESFAAALNSLLDNDNFSKDASRFREEVLVAKFIAASPRHLASELRLRRPDSLSDCVKIANSISSSPSDNSCMAVGSGSRSTSSATKRLASTTMCFRCGSESHLANDRKCPARNAICNNCRKKGHYAVVCKLAKSQVHVSTIRRSLGRRVGVLNNAVPRPTIDVTINDASALQFIVDTGAEVSVLSKRDCGRLPSLTFADTHDTFRNFDNSTICMLGKVPNVRLCFNGKSAVVDFFIADVPSSVLGMDAISALRLSISVGSHSPTVDSVLRVPAASQNCRSLHIKLKPGAPSSIIQPLRRLPFALEEPVEAEIRRLLAEDVIEPIDSSPYVSPILVTRKGDNSIRLCVDYRQLNANIIVDQYPVPSVDELFSKLKGARYFSKIDLRSAFHQINVADDSRDLTAFITHLGLFRFTKVPFGLASSPAAFNRILHGILSDCDHVIHYFDDILVFANSKADLERYTAKVRRSLIENNFVINASKSVYNASEIEFLGRHLSRDGVQPTRRATAAIADCGQPKSKQELRSFLGMIGFYRGFVPSFASIAAPLYRLLQEESTFRFGDTEVRAFNHLKSELLQSSFLAFYDTSADTKTILTTDASGRGLGAMLSQVCDGTEHPIYFVSRQLKDHEKQYSSSELELLAVIWAVERLHQYLYGRTFELRTDHAALKEVLTGKNKQRMAQARIVRWASRLLPYTFSVSYVRGVTNVVADCLSRLPTAAGGDEEAGSSEICIATIQGEQLSGLNYSDLRLASHSDETLCELSSWIRTGWPNDPAVLSDNLRPFYRFRDELSLHDGIILRGDKILVPSLLQDRLLQIAHQSHLGMGKTKSRLRLSYWWPSLDRDVEEMIRACFCCRQMPRDSPVQVTEWTTRPWIHLSVDIAGPKRDANGAVFYLVALVDNHSKYVCCKVVRSIATPSILAFLRETFATFGYCNRLTTDNGVQFTSQLFQDYLKQHGIAHLRSAVYNPQANGGIERVNRNFKKLIDTWRHEKLSPADLQTAISTYLLNYNNTVHGTTSKTPAELVFKYRPRTLLEIPLPDSYCSVNPELQELRAAVQSKLEKRAEYANTRRRPLQQVAFRVGDWVQKPPGPIRKIVSRCGNYTFQLNDGYKVNARNLKLIKRPTLEYVAVPSNPGRRYPLRIRRPVDRYGLSSAERGKM